MDHLAQATTDHNMQYVIKSTRRAGSTHGNYIATAKLKPPLNGHAWQAERPHGRCPGAHGCYQQQETRRTGKRK